MNALSLFFGVSYGQKIELCEGIEVRFSDAGHLLGSASNFLCTSYSKAWNNKISTSCKCNLHNIRKFLYISSASIEIWATEKESGKESGKEIEKKIVFSGDIGNLNQPIIKDPNYVKHADYVIMEFRIITCNG